MESGLDATFTYNTFKRNTAMKIMIDIGHPAHVHYYKNFIRIMKNKGHTFFITARDREFVKILLINENLDFISRGKGAKTKLGKLFYIIKADFIILWYALKFKPDIFLSHCSIYTSHVSRLIRKPCVFTGDTDSTPIHKKLLPFIDVLISPSCFKYNYGRKHVFFNSYMELMFLSPKYFKPNVDKISSYLYNNSKRNVLLRFVSWEAHHDESLHGISNEMRKKIIRILKPYFNIYISSEKQLDSFFHPFQITIPPYLMHDFYGSLDLFIGESATMASECAIMGVPAIYFDEKGRGYTDEQEKKYGLVYNLKNTNGLLDTVRTMALKEDLKESHKKNSKSLINDKIDSTAFLVWFIENYPESKNMMKENPVYQNRFKG